jgi:hypothetical protein
MYVPIFNQTLSALQVTLICACTICSFISVSWGAPISYPWPRQKMLCRPTELCAQFHWLPLPLWLWGLQIKASHGVSLRKSMDIYTFAVLCTFGICSDSQEHDLCFTRATRIIQWYSVMVSIYVALRSSGLNLVKGTSYPEVSVISFSPSKKLLRKYLKFFCS